MAKDITLMGASYPDVPGVALPKTGGGTALFVDPVEIIDDTAGDGDTDKVWSADKVDGELDDLKSAISSLDDAVDEKYEKPVTGIPSSDLADTFIEEPANDGTSGQVLTTDGNGGRSWTTVQGGGTEHGVPSGGSSGQVLAKASGTDYDVTWVNQSGGGGSSDVAVRASDATGVDLDITDNSGNVLARFKDGHFETKEFNSRNAEKVVQTTAGADLDIVDNDLNVILRLENGHIKTKNFDSSVERKLRTRMEFGAHNGAEYYAPECTIPAYRIAGQQGWEWAWVAGIDFSSEGTMYVIHDDTVDRTTDGTGYLNQMTDAQINALHITQTGAGYDLSDFDSSELIIPTFEQVLQQCVRYGMKMALRLALFPSNYDTTANKAKWDAVTGLLKSYGVQTEDISCYISSANQATICRTLFGNDVEIATFLGDSATAQDYVDWFTTRSITGKLAAIISIDNLSLSAVKLLHTNGIRAYGYKWNPSETDASNCATWGVDIFQNGKIFRINN